MATIGKLRNGNVIILFNKNEMAKIEIEKIVKIENKKKQKYIPNTQINSEVVECGDGGYNKAIGKHETTVFHNEPYIASKLFKVSDL